MDDHIKLVMSVRMILLPGNVHLRIDIAFISEVLGDQLFLLGHLCWLENIALNDRHGIAHILFEQRIITADVNGFDSTNRGQDEGQPYAQGLRFSRKLALGRSVPGPVRLFAVPQRSVNHQV